MVQALGALLSSRSYSRHTGKTDWNRCMSRVRSIRKLDVGVKIIVTSHTRRKRSRIGFITAQCKMTSRRAKGADDRPGLAAKLHSAILMVDNSPDRF